MSSAGSRVLLSIYMLAVILSQLMTASAIYEASAPKVVGLPFEKHRSPKIQTSNGLLKRQKSFSANIDNEVIGYYINITVGTPPQDIRVLLGTGSSYTWIALTGSEACQGSPDNCSFDPAQSVSFREIDRGAFNPPDLGAQGDYISDRLAIGTTVILNQTFGLVNSSGQRNGLLGIGYGIQESSAPRNSSATYPSVVAQLKNQGSINTQAYSLWLNDLDSSTGSILFGGIDTAKFNGGLSILPIPKSSPNNMYDDITVALSSISLVDASGKTAILQDDLTLPVILESGTTVTYLPEIVVNPFLRAIGAINDTENDSLVPCNFSSSPASLSFGFGGAGGLMINIPFSELVLPAKLSDGRPLHLNDGKVACQFGLVATKSQPYILGDTFLRSVYAVFDLDNHQIGLAPTVFNTTESNIVEISGSDLPSATATVSNRPDFSTNVTNTPSILPALTAGSAKIKLFGSSSSMSASTTGQGSGSATTTSTSAAATSTQPNRHGLSHSAKLGIGLSVPLGVSFLAIVGFNLYRYGRHRERSVLAAAGSGSTEAEKKQPIGGGDTQPKSEGGELPRRVSN